MAFLNPTVMFVFQAARMFTGQFDPKRNGRAKGLHSGPPSKCEAFRTLWPLYFLKNAPTWIFFLYLIWVIVFNWQNDTLNPQKQIQINNRVTHDLRKTTFWVKLIDPTPPPFLNQATHLVGNTQQAAETKINCRPTRYSASLHPVHWLTIAVAISSSLEPQSLLCVPHHSARVQQRPS